MTNNSLKPSSIASLAVQLQSGALDPVDLATETFAKIRQSPDQSIFTSLLEERAIKEATASRTRHRQGRSLGLLDGIPVAWKDLFDIGGIATTAGSKILAKAAPAGKDAAVVAALSAAGMVSVGRVNMSEFAFSGLGINPHHGTPRNPRASDQPRIPGGSSSGSGVAVAAGLVPLSIGTDTGGSVRIPAAFNGIVGYKATRGRYAMDGVFPLSKSLDSLGPLCRTVQDAIWVDAAMRGRTAPDIERRSLGGMTILVPQSIVLDDAEAGVMAAFEAGIEGLSRAGARIQRMKMPVFDEVFALMRKHGPLVTAEAYVLHHDRLKGPEAADMDHRVVARALLGERTGLVDYVEMLAARERLIAEFSSLVGPHGIIAFPTVPHVAPPIAPLERDDELFFKVNALTLRNTLIGNFLDWCGVSLPCGTGDAGMPVGMLLSALPHQDEHVLAAAMAAENVLAAI